MGIYRGPGGSGDATNDASSEITLAVLARDAAQAAQAAAEAAQAAAELAETNAETAETNAETAETNAETAATNAASSASSASTSATNAASSASSASTSATNAASSASSASTSATNAASSASSASSSASSASTSASNAATSATAAQAAQAAAEAAFDAFDDIYLGAKSSNPTVDNDGNALTTGDQYFNTVSNEMRVWNGSTWQSASVIGGTVTTLSVTGNTTLGDASTDTVTVNANNITTPNGIAINGTTIPASKTLVVTTDIGSTVQAYDADTAKLDVSQSWSAAQAFNAGVTLGDASGDALTINSSAVSIPNGLNFDSNTLVIDATNNAVGIGTSTPNTFITGLTLSANGLAIAGATNPCLSLTDTTDSANYRSWVSQQDTDMLVWNGANGNVRFATVGSERMRITSTGNVGIGTSSPSYKLHVVQSSGVAAGFDRADGSSAIIDLRTNGTTRGYLGASTSVPFIVYNASPTELMRLDSSGNLGLGVTPSNASLATVQSTFGLFCGSSEAHLTQNAYYNAGWKYVQSSLGACRYDQTQGYHTWQIAPSGTAGNAITFTQAMTLDASGNLGVGTSSPSTRLNVVGSDGIVARFKGSTGPNLKIESYSGANEVVSEGGNLLVGTTNGALQLYTGTGTATERMRIDSSGNLLVGTTSASTKVTVNLTSANDGITLRTTNEGAIGLLGMVSPGSNNDIQVGTLGNNNFRFFTNGTANERMRIDSSGNVGIGTSSPAGRLHVIGDTFIARSTTASDGAINFGSTNANYIYAGNGNNLMAFATNGSERMRIDSSGRLLVGTTSASGNNYLQVNSDASINGLTVGRGGGALTGNTALGTSALGSNTNAVAITAVGYQAGFTMNPAAGTYNDTFIGYQSGYNNTTGYNNTFLGGASGYTTSTGASNTAVGFQSLYSNTTASNNTAVGYVAGYSNTTGTVNTFIGRYAGYLNTTASNNTMVGASAGQNNTTGANNTVVGTDALISNTTASNNTAVGYQAGYSNTTGTINSTFGYKAGYAITTGNYNTLIGAQAGASLTTGSSNTFIGNWGQTNGAGFDITTGSKNTIIGCYTGNQGGLDIRTSSNYIVLSDGDGNPRAFNDASGYWTFGPAGNGTANDTRLSVVYKSSGSPGWAMKTQALDAGSTNIIEFRVNVGSSGSTIGSITYNGTNTVYNTTSDVRLKENIVDAGSGLDKISAVKIRAFDWKETGNHTDFGVIAQELFEIAPEAVKQGDIGEKIEDTWGVDTSILVPAMIKAIQELKAEVDLLKQQINNGV